MERKILGAARGAFAGWTASQIATDVLEDLGVPPGAATTAGAIIGAIII